MYRYRITLESLSPATMDRELKFEVENHDDLFKIANLMKGKFGLDEDATNALALGLKLLGETILKNRENPLFGGFKPQFADFNKSIKGELLEKKA